MWFKKNSFITALFDFFWLCTVSEVFPSCLSFSNGYSMFCAELMSSMKDVPSTERMVMCSQRWKLLKQGEKDAYQKRCEQVCNALLLFCILASVWNINLNKPTWIQMNVYQSLTYFCSTQRKKDYEIEMNRYLLVSILLWRQTVLCIFLRHFFVWFAFETCCLWIPEYLGGGTAENTVRTEDGQL